MVGSPQASPSWDNKSHLRNDTPIGALVKIRALTFDRRRGRGLRVGVTGENGGERGKEIHR